MLKRVSFFNFYMDFYIRSSKTDQLVQMNADLLAILKRSMVKLVPGVSTCNVPESVHTTAPEGATREALSWKTVAPVSKVEVPYRLVHEVRKRNVAENRREFGRSDTCQNGMVNNRRGGGLLSFIEPGSTVSMANESRVHSGNS